MSDVPMPDTPMDIKGSAGMWVGLLLVLAMALPMLILYATGALGPYLTEALGVAPQELSYLVLTSFGVASFLSLFAGRLVEILGLQKAFALHFLAIAFAFALIALAEGLYGMMGAVAIIGVSQAIANPVTNQLIALRVPVASKHRMVGIKQSGVQLSALFAGFALPTIADYWNWRVAFAVVVPFALLMARLGWIMAPYKPSHGIYAPLRRPNSQLALLMMTQAGIGAALSAYVTFLPSFAASLAMPPARAALLITLFGITGMISRIVITPVAGKYNNQAFFIVGLTGVAILAVLVTMSAGPSQHWPLFAGTSGIGLSIVATNAIAMGMVINDQRFGPVAQASGMVSAAFFAGLASGSILFGEVVSQFGSFYDGWVFTILVLTTSGFVCYLLAGQYSTRPQRGTAR